MKKFSKISNSPVGVADDKKIDKVNESDLFKARILRLMDDTLKVQMYGPVTRYHVAGTMKVVGKELFLEALMDVIKESSIKFDEKKLNELINESSSSGKISRSKEFLKSLYKRYKNDISLLMTMVERNIRSIKNGHTAYWRSIAAEDLSSQEGFPNSVMKEISKKYKFRSDQLGFRTT